MNSTNELLKLKILLQLLQDPEHTGTVTGLAQTFGQPKYTISRMILALEKENLILRPENRIILLAPPGLEYAALMDHRIKVMTAHLIRHGIDPANAQADAYKIAMSCSDSLLKVVEDSEIIPAAKEAFSDKKRISGIRLCECIPDGNYFLAFTLCRLEDRKDISDLFRHPGTLTVENGVGRIHFIRNQKFRQKVLGIRYLNYGYYVSGEGGGDIFTVPMDALSFVNQNEGLLYGRILLVVQCADESFEAEMMIYI